MKRIAVLLSGIVMTWSLGASFDDKWEYWSRDCNDYVTAKVKPKYPKKVELKTEQDKKTNIAFDKDMDAWRKFFEYVHGLRFSLDETELPEELKDDGKLSVKKIKEEVKNMPLDTEVGGGLHFQKIRKSFYYSCF